MSEHFLLWQTTTTITATTTLPTLHGAKRLKIDSKCLKEDKGDKYDYDDETTIKDDDVDDDGEKEVEGYEAE